jgi:arylsulfatase
LKIPQTISFLLPADETFDVGVDTRSPVNDADYQPPFAFNGTIDKVTFDLGPPQLTGEQHQDLQHARARAGD